jgi:1-phosphatidylinositol-4-phosphate 5-kinase
MDQEDEFHIEVIEYAPKVFKKVRDLEGITEDEIMESLNPLNNTTIIKSQGRSNSFFLSTDDSKFVLKTLKKEEFEAIFDKFLIFYLHYLENNPDSLICRIYGVFSVKANEGADPMLIILMRDAKGPMKNVFNF